MSSFEQSGGEFLWNGTPDHLIAGAIHYFRVPRAYWRDRMEKLLQMGCNTVETYLPWNLHEPRPGEFVFEGNLDIEAFLRQAQDLGLRTIVRPSPYICGEFEFGGQPGWLLKDPHLRVRSSEAPYRDAVKRYYAQLLPRLAAHQCTRGGSIIACQIENEYGYYGNDKDYLQFLKDQLVAAGIEVLLFTTDGPWGTAMESGSLEGVLIGASFGSEAPRHFQRMRSLRPNDPLFVSEFWMGWFDAWGDPHHVRAPQDAANTLEDILKDGHVNLYMFHGGTNFGFTSGANHYGELAPDVTSYDYDAPLSEAGLPTEKFFAFRQVIARQARDPQVQLRLATPYDPGRLSTTIFQRALGAHQVSESVSLDEALPSISRAVRGGRPFSMEELDQWYGYVLYRISLPGPDKTEQVSLRQCHDRAVVYVNGVATVVREGNAVDDSFSVALPQPTNILDVLVENQGRVNFGHRMNDQRKGILGGIVVASHYHSPVETWSLPMDRLDQIPWTKGDLRPGRAGFHRVRFSLDLAEGVFWDTFLSLPGWGKGVAWVNGHALGRFWEKGPQRTLYVPGAYLQSENELVLFESEGKAGLSVEFLDRPDLGKDNGLH